jgi:hypothetical protein
MIGDLKYNEFVIKAKKVHGNKYDYNTTNYIRAIEKVIIVCKKHGNFLQTPNKHLLGRGCPTCAKESRWFNCDELILRFKKIHGDSYKYDKSSYCGICHNMKIYCIKHKVWFNQTPHSHLNGNGCSICRKSVGELKIRNWLNEMGIEYEINKTFNACRNIKVLPFDFYLPKQNILIEYDGEQHYVLKNFGGISIKKAEERFNLQKFRDDIKNKFALNENITLIRIGFNENIIEKLNILML